MEEQVASLEAEAAEYEEQISEKGEVANTLSSKLKGEFENEHKIFKAEEEKKSKELVKVTSAWKNSMESTKNAESDVAASKALVEETKQALAKKEEEVEAESKSIDERLNAKIEAENELARLETNFQNMSAGLASSEGDEGLTLPDQIAKAHSDSKTAEAKVKQATMKLNHLKKSIKVRS